MLASDLIFDIRNGLLEPIAAFWADSELLSWINRAQADFCNRTRILEGKDTLSVVAGQSEYTLPADWVSSRGMFIQDPATLTWQPLKATNLEKMKQEHPDFLNTTVESRALPCEYWIWEKEVNLYPKPKDNTTIKMYFKAKPVQLTSVFSSIQVDDSLAQGIVEYVKWHAWEKEKELDLAATAKDLYFEYVGQGHRFVKKQSGDQKYRIDLDSTRPFSQGSGWIY